MESVTRIIPTERKLGIILEYRVTNPSRNPAEKVNGNVLINILTPALTPRLKESIRE